MQRKSSVIQGCYMFFTNLNFNKDKGKTKKRTRVKLSKGKGKFIYCDRSCAILVIILVPK